MPDNCNTITRTSTLEAQNRAAKSGNRPRFKRRRRRKLCLGQVCHQNGPMLGLICATFLALLGFLMLAPLSASCQEKATTFRLSKSFYGPDRELHLLSESGGSAPRFKRLALQLEAKRNGVQAEARMRPALADHRHSIKVAAWAAKLEQWFACRRAELLADSILAVGAGEQVPNAAIANSSRANCPAHFDGHLCWPASKPNEIVRLACPSIGWLSSQQKDSAGRAQESVINSMGEKPIREAESIKQTLSERPISQNVVTSQAFAWRHCELTNEPLANEGEMGREAKRRRRMSSSLEPLPRAEWHSEANYSACPLGDGGQFFDPTDEWIKLDQEPDRRLFASLMEELDRIEGAIDPYNDPDLLEQWSLCIGNIMRHQQLANGAALQLSANSGPPSDLWCPIIFDGWRCWPSTKADDIAYVSCPSNQPGFSAERATTNSICWHKTGKAHKICTSNGSWYRHPMTNRYWSNYTTCVDTVDLAFRTKILNLYVIGNLISLVALSASLIIFVSFKNLNCTRVTIHKNLFLSFITNNLMWIIWYTCVVNDANLLQSNPIECQFWHILLHYFLVSNYFWMFCEGLYLHTLLVVAFVSEDKILKWFYLLGWLTPVPITVAYAYNRSHDEYYTSFCWMEESPYNMILMTPIGISLLLNLVFLINIVRVLVTKLRANNSPDTHQTRKAVRATLILIPLLGLHYILTPFRPEAKSEWEGIYESIAAVCTSFQGLCVALLFCFCNGEVITVIKKKLKASFNLRGRSRGFGDEAASKRTNRSNNHKSNRTLISQANGNLSNQATATSRLPVIISSSCSVSSSSPLAKSIPLLLQQQPNQPVAPLNGTNNSNCSSILTTLTDSPVHLSLIQRLHSEQSTQIGPKGVSGQSKLDLGAIEQLEPLLSDTCETKDGNFSHDNGNSAASLRNCSITTSFSMA